MENFPRIPARRILLGLLIVLPVILQAQDEKELAPVSRTYAITNINIIQAPGRKVDMGTVVIRNGLILGVGKGIAIPPEAIIIKADSMYVYAGFIDGLSHAGVAKPKEENRERPKDPGNPLPERAGITPQNSVREILSPADKSVEELRALGFTAAHVVPYGGMLPGHGAIVLLAGSSADEMLISNDFSFYSALTPAERVYPVTVMGVMAKYRELYRQAALSKSYESTYASNRSGLERPAANTVTESFYPVIDKRLPVFFKAEKILEIQQVLTLQKELGFTLLLGEIKEGWDIINKLRTSNAKIFLSLDLPEEKKKDEKSADKKEDLKTDKKEEPKPDKTDTLKTLWDLEKETLEKRKADFIAKYAAQASVFQKAGVKFGFSTLSAKPKDITANLRRMIKAGLSEDAALASLTTSPAELLGLSDRLGTVDPGKIANLVISDKPYFNEKARVRYVFVDGKLFKMEVTDPKKSDSKPDLTGTWLLTTETPQGKTEGTLELKKDGDSYSGKVSGGRLPEPRDIEKVELKGNELKFSYSATIDGTLLHIVVESKIEGDAMKGTVTVDPYGSFPMEGKKTPKF